MYQLRLMQLISTGMQLKPPPLISIILHGKSESPCIMVILLLCLLTRSSMALYVTLLTSIAESRRKIANAPRQGTLILLLITPLSSIVLISRQKALALISFFPLQKAKFSLISQTHLDGLFHAGLKSKQQKKNPLLAFFLN